MCFCFMAVGAEKIMLPHVNINTVGREVECFVQIAVFDSVSTTAFEVAATAILTTGDADIFSNIEQINTFGR